MCGGEAIFSFSLLCLAFRFCWFSLSAPLLAKVIQEKKERGGKMGVTALSGSNQGRRRWKRNGSRMSR
jgi:hypothetical protein